MARGSHRHHSGLNFIPRFSIQTPIRNTECLLTQFWEKGAAAAMKGHSPVLCPLLQKPNLRCRTLSAIIIVLVKLPCTGRNGAERKQLFLSRAQNAYWAQNCSYRGQEHYGGPAKSQGECPSGLRWSQGHSEGLSHPSMLNK